MMKKNKIIVYILFLCVINLIIITGCGSKKTSSSEDTKEKVVKELDYIDTQIIRILNQLNNINLQNYDVTSEQITLTEENKNTSSGGEEGSSSQNEQSGQGSGSQNGGNTSQENNNITITQMEPKTVLESDENSIEWKTIKNEIEVINSAWAIILIDLSSLNVDNNDILNFSTTLDDCILSIKDENKKDTLTNLAKLYSFIPKYEASISAPNNIQNVKQVKAYIINAYSLVEQDDWVAIEANISDCEKTFKNIINDVDYLKNKEYKVNRCYVLIKELQNSLSYKDKKLFYVKYKNLLENVNTL